MNLIFENLVADKNLQILISMVFALSITWRSIPVIINICNLKGLMEESIKRSSHETPTPTFGGVAIFAGTLIGYMMWNFQDEGVLLHKVFAGLVILFFLGIKDDLFPLAPIKKLGSQVLVSTLIVVGSDLRITNFFGTFGIYEIPYLVSVLFSIFLFVALINSFNLIDGIDGLSGGIGMISSGGFGLWFILNGHWSLACLSLSLSASLLGFLRYNFSQTNKIFMGDTGSLIVGYIVTILAIQFVQLNVSENFLYNSKFVNAPVLAVVLLCVPIFDTLRVFGLRILKGKSPFKADRLHLHHLMIDNGMTHLSASVSLYITTVVLTLITYYLRQFFTNTELSLFVIGLFGVYLMVSYSLEVRRYRIHKQKITNKDEEVKSNSNGKPALKFQSSINPN
ncbi:undecaprenyl/decaprenyl-phosphate alpha-N-acetylglucosaminyl 1-phosphate transferase [Emticicia sp. CRIBPO]|jgi:UDP-GlcNAc:undecaprenyl-phosphate GlcNAc-1-phosphate transferase|uniref:MraY family glycosyltransferase n=1 Tax=Emticicia sp. CRIBPO TaxID=2683258 RepID=UPI001412C2A0|nr:MraY family glycosyltransferase [Emticicia sp. CRIBPO]NBA87602.1 undecaprenyl/decaprenyl-phosphate alpha-N-acetylglucosaminyl 1-phosphate transferase [Emticicia sp. CRIBPO]